MTEGETGRGFASATEAQAGAVTRVGVTALVRDETGRVLLGLKGRAFASEFVGKWVTPGGRVDYGETLERAVIREVQEETGLLISVRGPLWPQEIVHEKGHYVFFVFDAVPLHGTVRACDDLAAVRWYDAAELRALRDEMTPLTREIIDGYLASAGTEAQPTPSEKDSGDAAALTRAREALERIAVDSGRRAACTDEACSDPGCIAYRALSGSREAPPVQKDLHESQGSLQASPAKDAGSGSADGGER